jgi:hypothetical protein
MPIASSCKTAESQAFMLFMLLMSIASESDRIDLPDFAKRISGLLWLYISRLFLFLGSISRKFSFALNPL